MKKRNGGFSLVELIIVVAIMAVLVGFMAPQFLKYVEKAKDSKAIQTADTYRMAVKAAVASSSDYFAGNAVVAFSTNYAAPSRASRTLIGEVADSVPANGRRFEVIAIVNNYNVSQVVYHDLDTNKVLVWYLSTPQGSGIPITNQPCQWHKIDNDTNWISNYAGLSSVTWNS